MGMRVEPYLYGIVPPPAHGDTEPPQRLEVGGSTPRATANQSANEFSAATSSSAAAGDELSAAQSSFTAKDPKTKHDNSNNDILELMPMTNKKIPKPETFPMTTKHLPVISFIIPSTLARATLNRTIESLQKQSTSNWEAIVGVDLTMSKLTEEQVASRSLLFKQDQRVQFVPIPISETGYNRGRNTAGGVRNHLIRNYATSNWVAFVDDDDTLSPDYIRYWESGLQHDESADIIIFRMVARRPRPPLRHGSVASKNNVGISFAARKELFVRKQNGVAFVRAGYEDYNFLKEAQACNATILISDCLAYFVRKNPPRSPNGNKTCYFEDAIIADTLERGQAQKAGLSKEGE
jgi:hypothetical protein